MLEKRVFKNTFADRVRGDTLDVGMVIAGLRHGTIKEADLPKEVGDAVAAELARLEREAISPARALILLLGAMGEVRGNTRLQKYAFLVDMNMYSKKTRSLFTMYGWKPDKFGAHSSNLEYHVGKAIKEGLVETFPAYAPGGRTSLGYKLTHDGQIKFQGLLGAFEKDVALIKNLLARFKDDRSADPLIAYTYKEFPEYASKSTIRDRVEKNL